MVGAFDTPVRIPVKRSQWLLAGIGLAHGGAMCLLLPVALPVWIKWILLVIISASLGHSMQRYLYIYDDSPEELLLNSEDEWFITTRNNETFAVQLLNEHYVHPWLVVLPFRAATRNLTIILTTDMIDPHTFRRLRVRLRYKKT